MSTLLQAFVLLLVVWTLAYRRARMGSILTGVAVTLFAMTWFGGFAWLLWLTLVPVVYFYLEDNVRRDKLSRPVFTFFKRVLPPMSDTEQEALAMANDTHYGLASYVYTQNLSRAMRMFEGLQFGMVGINDINPTSAALEEMAGTAHASPECGRGVLSGESDRDVLQDDRRLGHRAYRQGSAACRLAISEG